jgi:uncharacterized transporter YbjL
MKKKIKKMIALLILCWMFMPISLNAAGEANEAETGQHVKVVLNSYDDSDPRTAVYYILIFLVGGPIFYSATKSSYSGETKRHEHEQTTKSAIYRLNRKDVFRRSVEKAKNKHIGQVYVYSNEKIASDRIRRENIKRRKQNRK